LKAFVASSANPEEVSLTIKGILIANVGLIVLVLKLFHVSVTVDEVTNVIGLITTGVGSAITIYGLLRKLYYEGFPKTQEDIDTSPDA